MPTAKPPMVLQGVDPAMLAAIGDMDEVFHKIEDHGHELHPCPLCGGKAEMWERVENSTGKAVKAGMCSNGEPIRDLLTDGCPLFMPPESMYRATKREAAQTWNSVADHFNTVRGLK